MIGKNGKVVFSENQIFSNFVPNSVILQIYGRTCRAGCGKESKKGLCDTIGWRLTKKDCIEKDMRGYKKLCLKRNHPRLTQTSLHCLQSWRANCDISILIYESDPKNPDPSEIAKVTDYVVSYACKGNVALAIEKKQVKDFTLKCEEETGDEKDIVKTVQKCLNRTVAQRTITKQETMCQLAKLPFVVCSETIDTISLSGAMKIENGVDHHYTTLLAKYNRRTTNFDKSLHQYFHLVKNNQSPMSKQRECVPHYVGGSGQPKFPITKNYARIELLKHKPWNQNQPLQNHEDNSIIKEFEEFVKSDKCPLSVSISLERAKNRSEMIKRGLKEPITEDVEDSQYLDTIEDQDTLELIHVSNNMIETTNVLDSMEQAGLDMGKEYDWGKRINQVS